MAFVHVLMRSMYSHDQGRPIRNNVHRRCRHIVSISLSDFCEFQALDNSDAYFSKLRPSHYRLGQRNKS